MKKKDEIKVCLVGSSGGHLTHLYMLKPFWKDKDHFWVTFDKEDEQYKKTICSTALCFTIITSLIVFFIMILARNYIAQYFFSDRQYAYVAYLSAMATLVGATNSIIAASTRMQNKRKVFLVTNTLSPYPTKVKKDNWVKDLQNKRRLLKAKLWLWDYDIVQPM